MRLQFASQDLSTGKAILDKIAKKNQSFTAEIATLRQQLRNFPEKNSAYVDQILKSAAKSNSSLAFFQRLRSESNSDGW